MCVTSRICRLCLSNERRTFSVTNSVLQNVWERLTNIKFDKDDGRPLVICYICCAHLRKSHELMERALKAEKLFTKYITNNHFEDSKELVSLIVCKANEIDYNYAIEKQFTFMEFKHMDRNTSEDDKEYYIHIKQEVDDNVTAFTVEAITGEEEAVIEDVGDRIKTEIQGVPMRNYKLDLQSKLKCIKLDSAREAKNRKPLPTANLKSLINYNSIQPDISLTKNSSTESNIKISKRKQIINARDKKNTVPTKVVKYINAEKKILKRNFQKSANVVVPSTSVSDEGNKSKTPESYFSCYLCPYRCIIKRQLNIHLRKHSGEKPCICQLCGYRCSHESLLTRHVQYKHTKEKNFSCHLCRYKCVQKGDLDKHIRTHTGEKPYTCDLCDYSGSRKDHLRKHMQIRHTKEKNFTCHICGHKFITKYNLDSHLRRHTGEKPFLCQICNCRYSHRSNLYSHMKTKHVNK